MKSRKIANSSNLPASMKNDISHFTAPGSHAKFSTGPSKFNPGPTLLRHVSTPVNALNSSTPNAQVISVSTHSIVMYSTKNAPALSIVLRERTSPFILGTITALG